MPFRLSEPGSAALLLVGKLGSSGDRLASCTGCHPTVDAHACSASGSGSAVLGDPWRSCRLCSPGLCQPTGARDSSTVGCRRCGARKACLTAADRSESARTADGPASHSWLHSAARTPSGRRSHPRPDSLPATSSLRPSVPVQSPAVPQARLSLTCREV